MSIRLPDPAMDLIRASMAAAMPTRTVQRSLMADPGNVPTEQLMAGVVSLVVTDGGDFANYRGREADLGTLQFTAVGFLMVPEHTEPVAIEQAELALLGEWLNWANQPGQLLGLDVVTAKRWQQSKQLEHPYGWITLNFDVRY